MAAVVGLTIVKKMHYRGDNNEEYSNQYWLTGSIPADSTAWKALADALIAAEKLVYTGDVWTVRAYGYDSDAVDATSVWSYDYEAATATVPGTLAQGSGILCPGDDAVWVRWKTSRTNSRGKPIYLRKYFHLAVATSGTGDNRDTVLAAQKTALNAFGTKLMDGSFLAARTIRSQTHAETILTRDASSYVTTRTLKRRGRRPS